MSRTKGPRTYALVYNDAPSKVIAFDLDFDHAEALRSAAKELGFNTRVKRTDNGRLPLDPVEARSPLHAINCGVCGHAAAQHPRVGFTKAGRCLSCYIHDIFVSDNGQEFELPICTVTQADVLLAHLQSIGETRWGVALYAAGIANAGLTRLRKAYLGASGATSSFPIQIADPDEARTVLSCVERQLEHGNLGPLGTHGAEIVTFTLEAVRRRFPSRVTWRDCEYVRRRSPRTFIYL